jgi:ubiquitin carboxyl-terminal hydrolase 5/13
LAFSDIDFPISQEAQGAEAFLSSVDQSKVDILISFGFTEELARKALKASVSIFYIFNLLRKGFSKHATIGLQNTGKLAFDCWLYITIFYFFIFQGSDIEKATDWIFNNPEASVSSDMDATTSNTASDPTSAELPDGGGSEFLLHKFFFFFFFFFFLF